MATAGLVPDLTLLLTLPPERGSRARDAARRTRPDGAGRARVSRARGARVRRVHDAGVAATRIPSAARSSLSTPTATESEVFDARARRRCTRAGPKFSLPCLRECTGNDGIRRPRALFAGVVLSCALVSGGWLVDARAGRCDRRARRRTARDVRPGLPAHRARFTSTRSPTRRSITRAVDGLVERAARSAQLVSVAAIAGATVGADVGPLRRRRRADRRARRMDHDRRAAARRTRARMRGFRPAIAFSTVDGKPMRGVTVDEAQKALRGAPGSTVRIDRRARRASRRRSSSRSRGARSTCARCSTRMLLARQRRLRRADDLQPGIGRRSHGARSIRCARPA